MATECFVRQLREEVDNNNLPRINTLHLTIGKQSGRYNFRFDNITDFEIVGDGYFTNLNDDNLGTILHRSLNLNSPIYVKANEEISLYVYEMSNILGEFRTYDNYSDMYINNRISFNIEEALQNEEQYSGMFVGSSNDTLQNRANGCRGVITNLIFNTKILAMSGCKNLRGSVDTIIKEQASSTNLNEIHFSQTDIVFSTDSLIGKKYLYITPNAPSGTVDVQYFGDTRARFIYANAANSKLYRGTIEELVNRLIASGRTGTDDYFYITAGVNGVGRWDNVTYNNRTIANLFMDYYNIYHEQGTFVIVFTWDAYGNISSEITKTEPQTKYVPLENVVY